VIEEHIPHVAVAGNPNSGKSTIFNGLTGLRQKVSNYPGVTVEKHGGALTLPRTGDIHLMDLPGTYSLNPRSLDEQVTHDVLMGLDEDTPVPRAILVVLDASNLERHLFFATQVLSLGRPTLIALNMMDASVEGGQHIRVDQLARRLGVRVVPMTASKGLGFDELRTALDDLLQDALPARDLVELPLPIAGALAELATLLREHNLATAASAPGEALRIICTPTALDMPRLKPWRAQLEPVVERARAGITNAGLNWPTLEAELRFRWIDAILPDVRAVQTAVHSQADRLDHWLTHPVWGIAALAVVVVAMFGAIFWLARPPMEWIKHLFGVLAGWVTQVVPEGQIQSLLTDGVIAGVGGVLMFLPQIMLLFLFIAIIEDSGYTARIAFLLDRIMSKFGLHGKAFIPLFSSFACAVPGIMAARTIDNARDRLITILVAPLMCCSARWPVYLLLAGTVIPSTVLFGFLPLQALVLGGLVLLGVVAGVAFAWGFRKTILRGPSTTLAQELPPYRLPRARTLLHIMWERSALFLKKAGTVILLMSVLMWVLTSYPRPDPAKSTSPLEQSFAGMMGRGLEPVIAPIGFDWRIGIAIVSSFAAREVFVSSMATIYGAQVTDPHNMADLQARLTAEKDDRGQPFFTPLRGITIMLFYVLAMQCVSTMVVVRRETGALKWVVFQWAYMTGAAWLLCFAVWQLGGLLGWR
jgi:ferrous iron transport protein B